MRVDVSYEMVGSGSLAVANSIDGPQFSICFLTIPNLGGLADPDELNRKIGELGLQGVATPRSATRDEVASEIVALVVGDAAPDARRRAAITFAYQAVREPLLSAPDPSHEERQLAGIAGWELDTLIGAGLGASLASRIGPPFQVALVGTSSCLTVLGSEPAVRDLFENQDAPFHSWIGRGQ